MMEPKQSNRGGSRPGAGRPLRYGEPTVRQHVHLPQSVIDYLRTQGDSLSDGIVRLAQDARRRSG